MDPLQHHHRFGTVIPDRVFVGGIPFQVSEPDIKNCFSQFGVVKDANIITDGSGRSKGYGFVTFEKQEDTLKVYDKAASGLFLKDKKLNIGHAIRKPKSVLQIDPTGLSGAQYVPMYFPYSFSPPAYQLANQGLHSNYFFPFNSANQQVSSHPGMRYLAPAEFHSPPLEPPQQYNPWLAISQDMGDAPPSPYPSYVHPYSQDQLYLAPMQPMVPDYRKQKITSPRRSGFARQKIINPRFNTQTTGGAVYSPLPSC